LENHWITGQEFEASLRNAGSMATPAQIERWRRQGLLPRPRQIGLGRGRGSLITVARTSVAQAFEIERLMAVRRKGEWVGWQLWLRGFDVSDHYWRVPIETAQAWVLEAQIAARQFDLGKLESDFAPEDAKRVILRAVSRTPLYGPLSKISAEYVETLGGFFQEILKGDFQGFSRDDNSLPNSNERNAVLVTMGVKSKAAHRISDFAGLIEMELRQISNAFDVMAARNSIAEPSIEARQELLAAFEVALLLNRNSKALFGGKALTTFKRIAANPAISLQAVMLLLWAEYRETSKTILPFADVVEMQKIVSQFAEK